MSEFSAAPSRRQALPVNGAMLRRLFIKQALPLGLIAISVWLFHSHAADLDVPGILAATRAIPPIAWAGAIAAMLVSFWAVGRYDAAIHRLMNTGVDGSEAQRAGITAVATAQTTGFGLLVGGLVRWRMMPQLTLWQSARVTTAVTISFMAALVVIGALAVLWLGDSGPVPMGIAVVVLAAALALAGCSLWRPKCILHIALPPLRAQIAILGLVALDTAAAAAAMYVLLPAADMPAILPFYSVFVLALGAGLIGATPGGLGPFELICLVHLPAIPDASLLAAITGYRLVYYGLPGTYAATQLILGPNARRNRTREPQTGLVPAKPLLSLGTPLDRLLHRTRRAEAQLLRQGEFEVLTDNHAPVALAAATGQSLIVLGDALPPGYSAPRLLHLAQSLARQKFLTPCLYKCSARTAQAARQAGWQVLPIAAELWVAPQSHDIDLPECRQVRRQLRKAEAAGLRATEAGTQPPLPEMRAIAKAWALDKGGARGFSMGRFDETAIERQRVFLCYDNQRRLVAFATFHEAQAEWALDLSCQTRTCPPGAMHLLIAAAIQAARARRCPRLSLAAVPIPLRIPRLAGLPGWVTDRIDRRRAAPGLVRFKTAFNPNREPLYIAAPSRPGLLLAGIDLVDRISRARPQSESTPAPDS